MKPALLFGNHTFKLFATTQEWEQWILANVHSEAFRHVEMAFDQEQTGRPLHRDIHESNAAFARRCWGYFGCDELADGLFLPAPVKDQAFLDALDPDKTKALLICEFYDEGQTVSWDCIKEIQAAIKEQALLNAGWRCSGCGSQQHTLTLRDQGHRSCCPDRALVPPA